MPVSVGNVEIGGARLALLAGPCVIESEELCLKVASSVSEACRARGIGYVFKASFDKANRTSIASFRGLGMQEGLRVLGRVKAETGVPVVTDIHEPGQAVEVAETADILQIPAFLCRQTDLLIAAGKTGRAVNIKKGQFLAPDGMATAAQKVAGTGNERILLTERGTTFGYGDLVVDMRSIPIMRKIGYPVIFDGTHSVQKPGSLGDRTGGDRAMVPTLCLAALAAGADALFIETHPKPQDALSDGPNSLDLAALPLLLDEFLRVFEAVQARRDAGKKL